MCIRDSSKKVIQNIINNIERIVLTKKLSSIVRWIRENINQIGRTTKHNMDKLH